MGRGYFVHLVYFRSKEGKGLNIRIVSTKHVDATIAKNHGDFAVAIWKDSSNVGPVPQDFSQVCWFIAYRRVAV